MKEQNNLMLAKLVAINSKVVSLPEGGSRWHKRALTSHLSEMLRWMREWQWLCCWLQLVVVATGLLITWNLEDGAPGWLFLGENKLGES